MRALLMLACAAALLLGSGCLKTGESVRDQPQWYVHVVQPGEFLGRIAYRYQVSVRDLARANDLEPGRELIPGQRLVIPGVTHPPPPTVVVVPTATKPATAWFRPRSDWTQAAIDVGNTVPMNGITRITVHHSDMPGDTWMEAKELLPKIERAHRAKGWAGIGYHFIIDRAGVVWEARPLQFQGAHAGNPERNKNNIGICVLGNFDVAAIGPTQLAALRRLLDRLREQYDVQRTQVLGHTEFDIHHTVCPGKYLLPVVEAYRRGQ